MATSPVCVSPASAPCSLNTSQLLHLSSDADMTPATWNREPAQPSSSAGSDQFNLACDEDSSCLEFIEAAPVQPAEATHARSSQGGPALIPFVAADTRELIRNELERQQELCYVPLREDAALFASTNRPRIVSWLVEVVSALRLSNEALHTALSLLDRFVAATEVLPQENMLQLLALACISIAAKHEEVAQYSTDDWVMLAVDGEKRPVYERPHLQHMEWLLMETVDWRIRVPNTLTFLRHYHHALAHSAAHQPVVPEGPEAAETFRTLANFLAELSLVDGGFLSFGYSTIATACLVLAEWKTKGALATSPTATAAAPPPVHTVAVLSALAGVNAAALAPNLNACVQALHDAYTRVMAPSPFGGGPLSATELGIWAPIVARHSRASQNLAGR